MVRCALAMCVTDVPPASRGWSFEHNQGRIVRSARLSGHTTPSGGAVRDVIVTRESPVGPVRHQSAGNIHPPAASARRYCGRSSRPFRLARSTDTESAGNASPRHPRGAADSTARSSSSKPVPDHEVGLIRRQRASGYMGQAEPVLEPCQVLLVASPLRDSQHLLVAALELLTTIQVPAQPVSGTLLVVLVDDRRPFDHVPACFVPAFRLGGYLAALL